MSNALPAGYAAEKLSMLRHRWEGEMGEAVREYGPRIWAGVPPTALVGLSASSTGPTEVIGNLSTSGSSIGLYGVEGPNLRRLCESEQTVAMLGRPARAALDRAGYLSDIPGQVVTGLENYLAHLRGVLERIPANLWQDGDDAAASSFLVRVAAAAYSAGNGIVSALLNHYAAELRRVPLNERWHELGRLINAETGSSVAGYAINGRYKLAFIVVRAEQRLESGLALERAVNGGARAAWFAPWTESDPALTEALTRRAYGGLSTSRSSSSGSSPGSSSGGAMLVVALLGFAYWYSSRG